MTAEHSIFSGAEAAAVANYQRLRLPRLSLAENFNARSPQSCCAEIKQLELHSAL